MWQEKTNDLAILVMRLVFGGLMIYGHGWSKLLRLFGGEEIKFMDFMGMGPTVSLSLAVFAEFLCALLIMFGAFTRLSAIPLIITMGVAGFIRHGDDPFSSKEKALLYLFAFVAIAIAGPGWYSVDARLRNKI